MNEIEAKYELVHPERFRSPRLFKALQQAGYTCLQTANELQVVDEYYDTRAYHLARAAATLRIRTLGEETLLTFKRQLHQEGSILSRVELEAPPGLQHRAAIQAALDEIGIERQNAAPMDDLRIWLEAFDLFPIMSIHSVRDKWDVMHADTCVGELSWDNVQFSSGDRRKEHLALELELASTQSDEHLRALSRIIEHVLGPAVQPRPESKLHIALDTFGMPISL